MNTFKQFVESGPSAYSWTVPEVREAWQMIQGHIRGSVHALEAGHNPKAVLAGLEQMVKGSMADLDHYLLASRNHAMKPPGSMG